MASVGMEEPTSVADASQAVQSEFEKFITQFVPEDAADGAPPIYLDQVVQLIETGYQTLQVNFPDLWTFNSELAQAIALEYYRFEPDLRSAVQDVVQMQNDDAPVRTKNNTKKEYFVAFYNVETCLSIRGLRSERIGQLVTVSGTVTRTTEVRPELLAGTFKCTECGMVAVNVEQQFKYTEPSRCENAGCKNKRKWELLTDESVFVDWQRLRVQENTDEIPPGSMPRTLDVILRHSCVERAKAGDKVTLVGSLIVLPDVAQMFKQREAPAVHRQASSGGPSAGISGLKSLGVRELGYRLAFLGSSVVSDNVSAPDEGEGEGTREPLEERLERVSASCSVEDWNKATELAKDDNAVTKLISSIAVTVHGHMEIKKGLLLMLCGGVKKATKEGLRLRGDMNVCVVGDPSTAKSQFLKWTNKFLPRSIYTSGKASSSAGLTASVTKDPDTGEYCVQAGALMLADNSVCCIDEFDKMDPADQVAIHEAMEQQTISITKAGIQATLNARTSILAAANPIFGRYDKTKTLRQNVNISPPILSRFDLFFVVVDDMNLHTDTHVARHIVSVHRKEASVLRGAVEQGVIAAYIRGAREHDPVFTPAAMKAVEDYYVRLRGADAVGAAQQSYRITVRQLESLIRLSEATARAHWQTEITPDHVSQAYELLKKSILTVDAPDVELPSAPPADVDMGDGRSAAGSEYGSDESMSRASDSGSEPAAGAKPFTVSYATYKTMAAAMVQHLREEQALQEQQRIDDGATEEEAVKAAVGVTQDELIEWYLMEHQGDELEDASDEVIDRYRAVVSRVVSRLLEVDHVLLQTDTEAVEDEGKRHLIAHTML